MIEGALEHRANETYCKSYSQGTRTSAARIFLRLVQPGEGTEDTKRRVSYRELLPDDPERAEAVTGGPDILADRDARLITTKGSRHDRRRGRGRPRSADPWLEPAPRVDRRGPGRPADPPPAHRSRAGVGGQWPGEQLPLQRHPSGGGAGVGEDPPRRAQLAGGGVPGAASRRKRRRVTAALVTSILVMISAVGGGAWFWQRQAQNRRHLSTAVEEALKDAKRLADAARAALTGPDGLRRSRRRRGPRACCESGVRDETLRHRVADASGGIPEEGEGA